MSLHQKTLYSFLVTEKVLFVSDFYRLLLLKRKKGGGGGQELERFSQEVFEVLSFSLVAVSSSTAFLISGPQPVSIFLTEQ